jgi:hypothetical protein
VSVEFIAATRATVGPAVKPRLSWDGYTGTRPGCTIFLDGAGGDNWRTWSSMSEDGHYTFRAYSLDEARVMAEAWHRAEAKERADAWGAMFAALSGERAPVASATP